MRRARPARSHLRCHSVVLNLTLVASEVVVYDPWDPAVMVDPYPAYARLRDEHRLYRHPELGFFVLSRFEDVAAGLRDHERLSSADGTALHPGPFGPDQDPPKHTHQRRVLSHPFRPRAMRRRAEFVTDLIHQLLDAAIDRVRIDAVADIANPLAMSSLAHTIGLLDERHEDWLELSRETFADISSRDPVDREGFSELQMTVGLRVDEIIEARKRSGEAPSHDDLVDSVVAAAEPNDAGWRLDRLGRTSTVTSLVSPGMETTRHLIGNAFELIARHPDRWRRVREGEVDVSRFVEEVLRYEAPVQGFFRAVREPFVVGDDEMPAGARVLLLYGSASRDERIFPDADRFLPDRPSKEHLAFGAGIHYCVGAGLARLEATTLFAELARRVEGVELADDGVRTPHALNRGWEYLPVALEPA